MTYSASLDPTVPGQAEAAKAGAGRIRALTLQVQERLASVFVDPNADPLVLKPSAVTGAQIAPGGVGTTQIASGAITTPLLASKAVDTAHIADGAVTATQLAAGAVNSKVDYTFTGIASTIAAGAVITAAPQAYGTTALSDGGTCYATFSALGSLVAADLANLVLVAWMAGGNINLAVKNTSAASISLTGVSVKVSAHKF